MKLGAIPSIILLVITAYLAIPSESNILFMFIDYVTSGFCPGTFAVCDSIPLLKTMVNIVAAVGFLGTLISILGQIFRGELFGAKKKDSINH